MVRPRRPGLTRRRGDWAVVIAAVLVAAGSTGCDRPIAGAAAPAAWVERTAGRVSLTQTPDVVSESAARDVAGIFADVEDFWRPLLPGHPMPVSGGYTLVDTAATDLAGESTTCPGAGEVLSGNALYCPSQDRIVIDAAALVPVLRDKYGIGGLAASLAHEFGHAVQARIGPTAHQPESRHPQMLREAQADCAAGAFLQWVVDGHSRRLHLPPAALAPSVAPLLDFRDAPGTSNAAAAGATRPEHGLSLDRLRFVLRGMRGGPSACPEMTATGLRLTLDRPGTRSEASPRFADPDAVDVAARTSVGSFDPGTPVRVADPRDTAQATALGQFARAAATALASGRGRYPDRRGAACFTGAWTSAVFARAGSGQLGSWPGDADEALDLIRNRPGATWAEIAAFADGFDGGLAACQ